MNLLLVHQRGILGPNPGPVPYCSPAFLSMISRSGPRSRLNAGVSKAATFNLGWEASVRCIALTVAARGARRKRDSSVNVKGSIS